MPIDRVDLDNICDYIPFVSTYTNVIDIIQKRRFIEETSEIDPPTLEDHYVIHIKNKSDIRSTVLLFPIIGNVLVGLYDIAKAFTSLFKPEEEEKTIEIGLSSHFKHVGSGTPADKKAEEADEDNLAERIDDKIAIYREKEFEEESAELNTQDIYDNTPPRQSKLENPKRQLKLEYIPHKEQRAYLQSIGFTPGFYQNSDHYAEKLLGNLSRNMAPNDSIRKELNDNSSDTEYVEHLRNLPVKKVMELINKISSGEQRSVIFREKFLMFLLLDPRLTFNSFININLSDLAKVMIIYDSNLKSRLGPLIQLS